MTSPTQKKKNIEKAILNLLNTEKKIDLTSTTAHLSLESGFKRKTVMEIIELMKEAGKIDHNYIDITKKEEK